MGFLVVERRWEPKVIGFFEGGTGWHASILSKPQAQRLRLGERKGHLVAFQEHTALGASFLNQLKINNNKNPKLAH